MPTLDELLARQDDLETRIRQLPVFGDEPIRAELAGVQAQIRGLQTPPVAPEPTPAVEPAPELAPEPTAEPPHEG